MKYALVSEAGGLVPASGEGRLLAAASLLLAGVVVGAVLVAVPGLVGDVGELQARLEEDMALFRAETEGAWTELMVAQRLAKAAASPAAVERAKRAAAQYRQTFENAAYPTRRPPPTRYPPFHSSLSCQSVQLGIASFT